MHRPDAREEFFVLGDLRIEFGEFRRHFLLDRAEFGRRHVARKNAVIGEEIAERTPRIFKREDRVLEGRWRRIVCDRVNFGEVHRHAGFDAGFKRVEVHLVECRNAAIGARPFGEKNIGGGIDIDRRGRQGEIGFRPCRRLRRACAGGKGDGDGACRQIVDRTHGNPSAFFGGDKSSARRSTPQNLR